MGTVDEKVLAYYWDIQNCACPDDKDPIDCVQAFRNQFGHLGKEKEFWVVCDVHREDKSLTDALTRAGGVTVVHISADCKQSADEIIKQKLDKFGSEHLKCDGTVILISSDQDYREQISSLRWVHHKCVILLHDHDVSKDFLKLPNAHYNLYDDTLKDVPVINGDLLGNNRTQTKYVEFTLEPKANAQAIDSEKVVSRLKQIFRNCSCKSVTFNVVTRKGNAVFNEISHIHKAKNRHGDDVFGHTLCLQLPHCEEWITTGNCSEGEQCNKLHEDSRKNKEYAFQMMRINAIKEKSEHQQIVQWLPEAVELMKMCPTATMQQECVELIEGVFPKRLSELTDELNDFQLHFCLF